MRCEFSDTFYLISARFRTKISDTWLKYGKVNLPLQKTNKTETKINIYENDTFTALSRFFRYADE